MLNKQKLCSLVVALSIGAVPFAVSGSTAYAHEGSTNESAPNVTYLSEEDSLIERVQQEEAIADVNSYNEEGRLITEVIGENGEVAASEILDETTNESISVTRTENSVIIEKRVLDEENNYTIIQESYPVIQEGVQELPSKNEVAARAHYGAWSYTGVAVGKNVFSTLTNIGVGALVSFTAGVLGITAFASKFLLGYMGAYGLSAGSQIANILDSNRNGWIGLHKRAVRNYNGGPLIGYQHRTY